jgi:hypothetical protein
VADQERGSDDPQLSAAARHALHDEELIAAFAGGDVDDTSESERARSLVERCAMCRDLHADLTQIQAAIRASGTAEQRAATPAPPRDYRLTAEDAVRLRPGTTIGRVARRLGWRSRLAVGIAAFGRPVGAAMATFGIVGILVGSLTLGGSPLAMMTAGAGSTAAPGVDQQESAPGASDTRTSYGPFVTGKEEQPGDPGTEGTRDAGASGSAILIGGSVAFVVLGLGLVLAARRSGQSITVPRGN